MRFLALCLLASPVFAQRLPTQPAEPPLDSAALFDDGTALLGNPAGLGFVHGLELDWIHDGAYDSGQSRSEGFLLGAGAGAFTLSGGLEFLRRDFGGCPAADPCPTGNPPIVASSFRRWSLGTALRLGQLSLGATLHDTSDGDPFQRSLSFDAGLIFRPLHWLAFGATSFDVNEPTAAQPRRWDLSLAVKPFREIELAGDLRWSECQTALGLCGFGNKEWFASLSAPIVKGVRVLAQVGALEQSQTSALVGLQLDFDHLGVTYATRFQPGHAEELSRVRLSSQSWEGVHVPKAQVAEIDLDKALEKPKAAPLEVLLGATVRDPFARLLSALERVREDSSIKAVVFRTSGLGIGMGRADELIAEIEALKAAGKKVLFYLESGGDLEYSVAVSADRIYAAPQAVLLVNGFSATALFAAAGLNKLGVKAEFFRVGAYKNAPDLFTRSGMSGEQREVTNALLDDAFARYLARVGKARGLAEDRLKSLLDQGLQGPGEAKASGLLDGLLYPDQLEEEAGKLLSSETSMHELRLDPPDVRDTRWGVRPRIAVVRVEGDIVHGEGVRDPFGAVTTIGSGPVIRAIRSAADDPQVAAIVVRIDSPGGDGTASDLIWRELIRAREEKHKPVIASMGDVAASGGYYVAAGAETVFAEPSTITGSIGVFIGHFDASDLFEKLGLHFVTNKRGESADLFSPGRALTDPERKSLQAWVDSFYAEFVDRVASARKLSHEQVDAIARGRVWTGAQALDRKLIDRLGSLEDAIREAKRRAGYDAEASIEVEDESEATFSLSDFAATQTALPHLLQRALGSVHLLGEPGTVRAALPFELELQ